MEIIASFIEEEYGVTAVKMPDAEPVESCFVENCSYSAEDLINHLAKKFSGVDSVILVLTDRNLFSGKNGAAAVGVSQTGLPGYPAIAVISLGWAAYGLEDDDQKYQKFFGRALKITSHELGHALGRPHCPNRRCALYTGEDLNIDERPLSYCPKCRKKIEHHLRLAAERANWKNLSFGKKIKWQLQISWIVLKRIIPRS
jgi:archaemetzincin